MFSLLKESNLSDLMSSHVSPRMFGQDDLPTDDRQWVAWLSREAIPR